MVHDDIYRRGRTFKVVVPGPKSFEDSEKLLIMGVVVQLQGS